MLASRRVINVSVALGARRYPVRIGTGLVRELARQLAPFRGRRIAVVSNPRVWSLHGRTVERQLQAFGTVAKVLVRDGERFKSWSTLRGICDALAEAKLGRDGLVVAVGGGVVGDAAGFAAAIYMRGIDYIQVPTTLLAMVDSSIGGKTAINHESAKNLIGAFHQPRAVLIDPALLATLPRRETQSGAYEILKCAVLLDPKLFQLFRSRPPHVADWSSADKTRAIAAACRIKAEIVSSDEREGGRRRLLNLGHTIGHALEAVTGYRRFSHGEAVGWGMIGAAAIAQDRGLLDASGFEAIAAAVDRIGPRPHLDDLADQPLLAALALDKKARAGRVPFLLPHAVGRVRIHDDVKRAEIVKALRTLRAR